MLVALTVLGIAFVPLFPAIQSGSVPLIGICTTGIVGSIIVALSAPASFFADAFPVRMRYFGSSIAYTATNVIFGGTAAVLVAVSFVAVWVRPANPEATPDADLT